MHTNRIDLVEGLPSFLVGVDKLGSLHGALHAGSPDLGAIFIFILIFNIIYMRAISIFIVYNIKANHGYP